MSEPYKDWIVRFYASHNDIPKGHADGGIVGELIRCKVCLKKRLCSLYRETHDENGFCAWGDKEE